MTQYTSGYRAAHGLPKANHDPHPWKRYNVRLRRKPYRDGLPGVRYAPRPEFDVPDNPILAAYRKSMPLDPANALGWLAYVVAPAEQIEHARKVLTKLAALA